MSQRHFLPPKLSSFSRSYIRRPPIRLSNEVALVPVPFLPSSILENQRSSAMPPVTRKFARVNVTRRPLKPAGTMHSVVDVHAREGIAICPGTSTQTTLDSIAIKSVVNRAVRIRAATLSILLAVFVIANVPEYL